MSLNLEVLIHRSGVQDLNLDLEPITGVFRELASAYSREFPSKLLDSIPEDLRLDTAQETLALARTTFEGPSYPPTMYWYPLQQVINPDWKFNAASSGVISDVIVAAGGDPSSMTVSQMDSEDTIVQCVSCRQPAPIMGWRSTASN